MAFFTVSRRELLTSAAGIAATISHTKVLGKSEIGTPTIASVSDTVAVRTRHFSHVTLLRVGEIAERNRVREEVGMPLLSVAKELRRMKEAADTEKFRKFAAAHRKRVHENMLARARRRIGDPNWAPTGVLSGGGLLFGTQVDGQLRRLHSRTTRAGVSA